MRVKITLNHVQLEQAKAMRKLRGIPTPEEFEGPDFSGVQDTSVGDGFVSVLLEDVIYSYPVSSVARIAQYREEGEPEFN